MKPRPRLGISNIAWPQDQDLEIAKFLEFSGISTLEIAPTKLFPNVLNVSDSEIFEAREFWNSFNIKIGAMQSLLFGQPGLTIFESASERQRTLEYLTEIIKLASRLGAETLVFGSPKNRRIPIGMSTQEASRIAVDFFRELGKIAEVNETVFCIEPNPLQYGCNFVTSTQSGRELVEAVNRPGFQLHLDTAAMSLSGEDMSFEILASQGVTKHFHVSAPQLGSLDSNTIDYEAAFRALAATGYEGIISIEMLSDEGRELAQVQDSVNQVKTLLSSSEF